MYLLDSVILIDHFNNIPAATQFIKEHYTKSAISIITRTEVLVGFNESDQIQAKLFLDKFSTLDLNVDIADLAAKLRQEHHWKLPDALQAALATHHKLTLVTRNTRDFEPGKHSFVTCPYTLN